MLFRYIHTKVPFHHVFYNCISKIFWWKCPLFNLVTKLYREMFILWWPGPSRSLWMSISGRGRLMDWWKPGSKRTFSGKSWSKLKVRKLEKCVFLSHFSHTHFLLFWQWVTPCNSKHIVAVSRVPYSWQPSNWWNTNRHLSRPDLQFILCVRNVFFSCGICASLWMGICKIFTRGMLFSPRFLPCINLKVKALWWNRVFAKACVLWIWFTSRKWGKIFVSRHECVCLGKWENLAQMFCSEPNAVFSCADWRFWEIERFVCLER